MIIFLSWHFVSEIPDISLLWQVFINKILKIQMVFQANSSLEKVSVTGMWWVNLFCFLCNSKHNPKCLWDTCFLLKLEMRPMQNPRIPLQTLSWSDFALVYLLLILGGNFNQNFNWSSSLTFINNRLYPRISVFNEIVYLKIPWGFLTFTRTPHYFSKCFLQRELLVNGVGW